MKICPVCGARCFDDMEVCYGCLHTFASEPPSALQEAISASLYRKEPPVSLAEDRHPSLLALHQDELEEDDFEPEPASDSAMKRAFEGDSAEESSSKALQAEAPQAECSRKQSLFVRIDLDETEGEQIEASVRLPKHALSTLLEVCRQ